MLELVLEAAAHQDPRRGEGVRIARTNNATRRRAAVVHQQFVHASTPSLGKYN